jgi:hypothetical protein
MQQILRNHLSMLGLLAMLGQALPAGALGEAVDLVLSAASNPVQAGGQILESAATIFQVGVNGVQLAAQQVKSMPVPSLTTAPIVLADSAIVRVKSFIAAGGRLESEVIRDCLGLGSRPVTPSEVERGIKERCGVLPYSMADPDWKRLETWLRRTTREQKLLARWGILPPPLSASCLA